MNEKSRMMISKKLCVRFLQNVVFCTYMILITEHVESASRYDLINNKSVILIFHDQTPV